MNGCKVDGRERERESARVRVRVMKEVGGFLFGAERA
jgi:hypothetical protein